MIFDFNNQTTVSSLAQHCMTREVPSNSSFQKKYLRTNYVRNISSTKTSFAALAIKRLRQLVQIEIK